MTAMGDLDPDRIGKLHAAELRRGSARLVLGRAGDARSGAREHMPNGVPMAWMASDNDQPVYIDHGRGAAFTDLDGFSYVDFNASDMAMFCGHANPQIVAAVREQAARSTQFLLPTQASVEVAEELAGRYPVPLWQFTLSATQANTEVIRLARAATGRDVVVLFQGHYHGHFDEGLVDLEDGQVAAVQRGLSKGVTGRVRIAQFNDIDTLRAALAPGDVALVLTEPAMTNNLHLLLPEPGWHQALRDLTHASRRHAAGSRRDPHPRGRARRRDRTVAAQPRYGHDREGDRRRAADGCLRGHRRAGRAPGRCTQPGYRGHIVRQPAVRRRRQGGTDPGAGARRLCAHRRPGRPSCPPTVSTTP